MNFANFFFSNVEVCPFHLKNEIHLINESPFSIHFNSFKFHLSLVVGVMNRLEESLWKRLVIVYYESIK
jgi:hypothetical protein